MQNIIRFLYDTTCSLPKCLTGDSFVKDLECFFDEFQKGIKSQFQYQIQKEMKNMDFVMSHPPVPIGPTTGNPAVTPTPASSTAPFKQSQFCTA